MATRDEQIDQLLTLIQISDVGVIRFCPKNPDGTPHQRMAIGPTGLSVSDDDPDPAWYASANAYFGGRVGIQSAVGFHNSPEQARVDLDFNKRNWQAGFPSSLQVENNNIPDQVVAQFWQASKVKDLLTNFVLWLTPGDSSRGVGRNTTLRVDAGNDQGQVGAQATAIEMNLFGADPDNRAIDVSESSNPSMAATIYTGTPPAPVILTDTQYVTILYTSLLNRGPDAGGLANWTHLLASGWTRDQVRSAFINSQEYRNLHP